MSLFDIGVAPALDSDGNPISGARWQFTLTGTTTTTPVYADADLNSSLGSHVASDSAGRFVDIYIDDTVTYRARLWPDATMTGTPIKDIDPINDSGEDDGGPVEDADNSNSETNDRPIEEMTPADIRSGRQHLRQIDRRPGADVIDSIVPIAVGERMNLWGQSENLAHAYYNVSGSGSAKQTDTIEVDGITLTRFTVSNFFGALNSNIPGNGLTPFTIGERYLFSYYIIEVGDDTQTTEADPREKKFWMRALVNSSSDGHDARFATNQLRRVWMLGEATATDKCDYGPSADVALGGTAGASQVTWYQSAQNTANVRNVYVGGFQIENCGDNTYKDGIAMIGDSTLQGASGTNDVIASREVAYYVSGLLNCPVFNRAAGGETTVDMDARWGDDITPLAVRCSDVLIQGGINDIGQGRTLTQIQGNINSMVAKAEADGLRPILLTCTPTTSIIADPDFEEIRQELNTWIRETFVWWIDIAPIVEDPHLSGYIRDDESWYGDGIHYLQPAKRAVGAFIASWPHWNKREPGPYQPNLGNQTAWTPPTSVVRGSAGQLIGQRDTGWTAMSGSGSKGALAAAAAGTASAGYVQAEAQAALNRIAAMEARLKSYDDALFTHGLIGV